MEPRTEISLIIFMAALAHFSTMMITVWYVPTGMFVEVNPVGRWVLEQPLWLPFAGWAALWSPQVLAFHYLWPMAQRKGPENTIWVQRAALVILGLTLFDFLNDLHVAYLIESVI